MNRPSAKYAGIVLLAVQVALASSVAAKYALDRVTRPRVWARTQPYDPAQPLRGRYLALQVSADVCSLQQSDQQPSLSYDFRTARRQGTLVQSWPVRLVAQGGVLTAQVDANPHPGAMLMATLFKDQDCHRAHLSDTLEYFIPEHARSPFPLAKDTELWVEVTLPSAGPPRPIQLAISDPSGWHLLHF